jgi:hypothetical protein
VLTAPKCPDSNIDGDSKQDGGFVTPPKVVDDSDINAEEFEFEFEEEEEDAV